MDVPPSRLDLGRIGEAAALGHYRRGGYRVVARNWRCALGEVDLVLARGSLLVFCEVKARRALGLGGPYEAVNGKKQRKLRNLAEAFLGATGQRFSAIRFDVASVTFDSSGHPSVFVFEEAF